MITAYLNVALMLMSSWAVYYSCQQDAILPISASLVIVVSWLIRGTKSEERFLTFDRIPLSVVILGSGILGYLWRMFIPIPPEASSPFPEITAALQSGAIIAGVWIWLKPFQKQNFYRLVFCAWLTTALAINVPFRAETLMTFSTFCFVSIAVVILTTMHRPQNPQYHWMYIRQFIGYAVLLMGLTTLLFFVIARSIVALDNAFLNIMSDYVLPRSYTNFLSISPKLNLINPGLSAFDRRPIMEVSLPKVSGIYLKFQVFQTYQNGVWFEAPAARRQPMKTDFSLDDAPGQMTMFTTFQNIIPSPYGIRAIRGRDGFDISEDQLVYSREKRNTQMIELSTAAKMEEVALTQKDLQNYLMIPESIKPQITELAQDIVGTEPDQLAMIRKIVQHFRTKYSYSLDVDFTADDAGLLKMLKEHRPAYCTYFASATTLLLRSQGIPSRVAAGFLTTEITNPSKNTFLVRVKNAHAWTEVYWENKWLMLDSTPVGVAGSDKKNWYDIDFQGFFERLWIFGLRYRAVLENMDKDQLKLNMIGILILVMVWMNRSALVQMVMNWKKQKPANGPVIYQKRKDLIRVYQQYERFLLVVGQERRKPMETDDDVLHRLKRKAGMDPQDIQTAEQFVRAFREVRFGRAEGEHLLQLMGHIRKRLDTRHTE